MGAESLREPASKLKRTVTGAASAHSSQNSLEAHLALHRRLTFSIMKHDPGEDNDSVDVAEGHSLWRSTPQHIERVSQDQDFRLQRRPGPEHYSHGAPDQPAAITHRDDNHRFAATRHS